jgi:sugar transferase (PEP-CTERM/EpsH1 system associated)
MNILFVCHRLPFPPNRGGKIRPFNMIRHLSQKHSVTVASLAHSQSEMNIGEKLLDYCTELIAEVMPATKRWGYAIRAIGSVRPSSCEYFWSPALQRRIQEVTARRRFGLVIVHCAFVARYVDHLKEAARILDYGDLDSGKWWDYSRQRGFPFSLGYKLEFHKLRKYETKLSTQFDRFTVTSPGELNEFRKLNDTASCTLVTNGVDINYFAKRESIANRAPVIVFLGRMDYFPNVDGIFYFVREIFPIIRSRIPSVQLKIVGSNPLLKIKKLENITGVTVTGFVEDVRPFLAEATVAIAPLRIARGTQNKILE